MTRIAFALILSALLASPAFGQVFESVGTRALGMGGAFVAVADDGFATYWNPAGLASGATLDLCAGHAQGDLGPGSDAGGTPGGEATSRSFCLAIPAIGLSYNTLRVTAAGGAGSSTGLDPADRQDLRPHEVGVSHLVTRQFGLTLVQSLTAGIAVGTTIKAVRGSAAYGVVGLGTSRDEALSEAEALEGRASTALDLDVGMMAVAGHVKLGLVLRNVREPSFETASGERIRLRRQARLGLAVTPGGDAVVNVADPSGLVIAFDADLTRTPTAWGDRRQVAVGAERWWAGRRLGLRAGGRASTVDAARPVATAGMSVGLTRGILVEAAATRGHRDGDRGWALAMRISY